MTIRRLHYTTNKYIPIAPGCCEKAYICLSDDCAQLTLDGTGFVEVIVEPAGRRLGHSRNVNIFENPRCEDLYQYTLLYDDVLVSEPLTCGCIAELNTNYCAITRLIELSTNLNFDRVCMIPTDTYPTDGLTPPEIAAQFSPGCLISLVGHVTDPNGLYMWDGAQWVQQAEYAQGI